MAEPPAAAAASAPPTEGPEEKEERSPGGARPAAEGVVSESDPGEKKADPEQFLTPPAVAAGSKKNISSHEATGAAARRRSQESPRLSKSPRGPSPKRSSPWRSSPRNDRAVTSFSLSPRLLGTTPQAKRRSWCRSSLKGIKRRKSLPPVHQDVTELSKSISLDLPEIDRLSMLLLSSFQFSAQKFEHVLKQSDGFSPEAFKTNVHSVSEDLRRYMQKLKRDGTLRSCVEDPKGILPDSALDESVAQIKEYIARFSAECQSWDQLLLRYQESAEEMSRALGGCRSGGGRAPPLDFLRTSQAQVLRSKPDYRRILEAQGEALSSVELALDELQQAAKLLRAFSEDSQRFLRCLSQQLATRTFRQLADSPVRKLIAAPPRETPPAEG
ncbi:kinetochore-associated protein DSN1 homolog [Numenius arquata]|uniref:kinetochore-associated protein DSN1 homolog n=1 Tax=Numenius arquata TaxID=31919 RepID=UPI003D306985